MTTQQLYQKVINEQMSKNDFLWNVRRDNNLSTFITNTMSFDDTVKVLKAKGHIAATEEVSAVRPFDFIGAMRNLNEAAAKKKVVKKDLKKKKGHTELDADHVNYHEFTKGWKHELEHTDDIDVAKQIALDHLAEDPNYYTRLDMIEYQAKKEKKKDSNHEVKKGNVVDKENQMVPAPKKKVEAKKPLKEADAKLRKLDDKVDYDPDTVYAYTIIKSGEEKKGKLSQRQFNAIVSSPDEIKDFRVLKAAPKKKEKAAPKEEPKKAEAPKKEEPKKEEPTEKYTIIYSNGAHEFKSLTNDQADTLKNSIESGKKLKTKFGTVTSIEKGEIKPKEKEKDNGGEEYKSRKRDFSTLNKVDRELSLDQLKDGDYVVYRKKDSNKFDYAIVDKKDPDFEKWLEKTKKSSKIALFVKSTEKEVNLQGVQQKPSEKNTEKEIEKAKTGSNIVKDPNLKKVVNDAGEDWRGKKLHFYFILKGDKKSDKKIPLSAEQMGQYVEKFGLDSIVPSGLNQQSIDEKPQAYKVIKGAKHGNDILILYPRSVELYKKQWGDDSLEPTNIAKAAEKGYAFDKDGKTVKIYTADETNKLIPINPEDIKDGKQRNFIKVVTTVAPNAKGKTGKKEKEPTEKKEEPAFTKFGKEPYAPWNVIDNTNKRRPFIVKGFDNEDDARDFADTKKEYEVYKDSTLKGIEEKVANIQKQRQGSSSSNDDRKARIEKAKKEVELIKKKAEKEAERKVKKGDKFFVVDIEDRNNLKLVPNTGTNTKEDSEYLMKKLGDSEKYKVMAKSVVDKLRTDGILKEEMDQDTKSEIEASKVSFTIKDPKSNEEINVQDTVASAQFNKDSNTLIINLAGGNRIEFNQDPGGAIHGTYFSGDDKSSVSDKSVLAPLSTAIKHVFDTKGEENKPEPENPTLESYIRKRIQKAIKLAEDADSGAYNGYVGKDVVKKKLKEYMARYQWDYQNSEDPAVRDRGQEINGIVSKMVYALGDEGVEIFNDYAPEGYEIKNVDDLGKDSFVVGPGPQDKQFYPNQNKNRNYDSRSQAAVGNGGRIAENMGDQDIINKAKAVMTNDYSKFDVKDLGQEFGKFITTKGVDNVRKNKEWGIVISALHKLSDKHR